MAIHLFIDTNAYLSFYHFTKDDIATLSELGKHVSIGYLTLHLPEQVRDEWKRNRDARLSHAAKEFQKSPFATEIPRHMQTLQMAETYARAVADAKKARELLIAEATVRARTYELDVDVLLTSIFIVAEEHAHDEQTFAKAKLRAEKGNPPGKSGSFGDQYNWEMLLERVPDGDLYIVTKDGDYASVLDGKDETGMTYPNAFLKDEWRKRKNGNLFIFDGVKGLLAHYQKLLDSGVAQKSEAEVKLATPAHEIKVQGKAFTEKPKLSPADTYPFPEAPSAPIIDDNLSEADRNEKEEAIGGLANSVSFADTHNSIARLSKFHGHFTTKEATYLCDRAFYNSQIGRIINDDDVYRFYSTLLGSHFSMLDPETLDIMIGMLGLAPSEEEGSGEDESQSS